MSEPAGEALDIEALDGLRASVEGDTAFVIELIDAFLADSALQLTAIESAVAAGDADALIRPAHTLKSASATLGATRLSATARTLETAGRAGEVGEPDALAAADAIRAEWHAAASALRAWAEAADA